MLCSGCGKDIPFVGSVCPYCQRDKTKDQQEFVLAMILGLVLGYLGLKFFGFWGAIGGFFGGILIAAIMRGTKTLAPEVRITKPQGPVSSKATDEARLRKIKELFDKGLIDEAEYQRKKNDVLNDL
jgi:uncharacterized membrane protein